MDNKKRTIEAMDIKPQLMDRSKIKADDDEINSCEIGISRIDKFFEERNNKEVTPDDLTPKNAVAPCDCGKCVCSTDQRIDEMMKAPSSIGYSIKNNNMGALANSGLTRDDSSTATRLLDKNWSPLIIRKYQMFGWPMFIGIICDCNLNDLDDVVYNTMDMAENHEFINGTIQGARNACGFLSDEIVKHYNAIKRGVVEGIIVFWYQDKLAVSSAYGDLMTHEKCAAEFYSILNMMPHI